VNNLDLNPGQHVVEIGPGLGALTHWLLEHPIRLTLIEFDPSIAADWAERLATHPNATVIEADAAQWDYHQLIPSGPFQLVGNLPYSAATAILAAWLDPALPISRAVAMVQKEVGQRLTALPDCKDYGALSVRVQQRFETTLDCLVPPSAFKPAPKIESAVIRFDPQDRKSLPPCRSRTLDQLLRAGFGQRRKQLGKLFRGIGVDWETGADFLQVDPRSRAEDLSLKQWCRLARWAGGFADQVTDSSGEWFDIVDENDAVTGQERRSVVHEKGLRHRAVHIFITNPEGHLLLQLRSIWKDNHPLVWDSSAAGHVSAGDDYLITAEREIEEELGVQVRPREIGRIAACEETGMEFVRIYHAEHPGPFQFDPDEIDAVHFFDRPTIHKWIDARPQDFAPAFIGCLRVAEADLD